MTVRKVLMRRCAPVLLAMLHGVCAARGAPLRLGTQDRAPYGFYQPDGSFDGMAVRVIDCALKKARQPYSLTVYPWERVQVLAKIGELDGFFPASERPDRAAWSMPSVAIAEQKWVWYLPANSKLDPHSAQFRQHARVGAHFGSARLKMLEQEHYQVSLSPQGDRQLLQAFMAGRADAILGADQALAHAARELKIDPAELKIVVVKNTPQMVFFSKAYLARNPAFLERFNAQVPGCKSAQADK